MSNKVTQEAYDEEIRELMEDLGMTEEEAIQDTVNGYEMKVPTPSRRCFSFLLLVSVHERKASCSLLLAQLCDSSAGQLNVRSEKTLIEGFTREIHPTIEQNSQSS